ncbi:hypothetical protein UB43_28695 [Pseudomonas sp. 21]|nr:hypothetical protein UB43_28695 [Pseudomonas sp. 21]
MVVGPISINPIPEPFIDSTSPAHQGTGVTNPVVVGPISINPIPEPFVDSASPAHQGTGVTSPVPVVIGPISDHALKEVLSHGLVKTAMELDLNSLGLSLRDESANAHEIYSKTTLPSLSNVLEVFTQELPLAHSISTVVTTAVDSIATHYAPVDFPLVNFDELTIQNIVV